MGVKTIDSDGGGYALFDKGENVYIKPTKIEPGWNDRENEPQLVFRFRAISTEDSDGEPGTIPGYLSSKITIQSDEDFNSFLGNLLVAAGVAEAVLDDIGVDEDDIEGILDPDDDRRYEAEDEKENQALYAAVVSRLSELDNLVLKAGTKQAGKDNDYSKINGIYKRVEKDPFPDEDDDGSGDAESGDDEESKSDDDDDEEIEEVSTSADVEKQAELA